MSHIIVRNSTHTDMSAVQRIYAYHVLHGLGSFEEEPPSFAELRRRRDDVIEHGLPYVVADIDRAVVGYSYATLYRDRSAYRYTVEDSVYVDQGETERVSAGLSFLLERRPFFWIGSCEKGEDL